ncbi:hypothetical protein DFH06DRAFT_1393084 [Mycena polygramma]|nr:hypothetical protein DFH06DRAFT_1393084 [Mycena polygramma]
MSNIVLSAKPSDQWTSKELAALNISVEAVDALSFFGHALPDPQTDPALLAAHPVLMSNETLPPASSDAGPISKDDRLFFAYLRHVAQPFPVLGPTGAVLDFTAFLLQMLNYDEPEGSVRRRVELEFLMCGERVTAKLDVVVMHDQDYILPVQVGARKEDDQTTMKRQHYTPDAEPQLIAAAVAAHSENNRRRRTLGLPTVSSKVFAGLVMNGSAPTFYQIPVSEALVEAVGRGDYPLAATVVRKFVPPVNNAMDYFEEGMGSLANRRIIFQCLGALKASVV